jgi:hypothetical protein
MRCSFRLHCSAVLCLGIGTLVVMHDNYEWLGLTSATGSGLRFIDCRTANNGGKSEIARPFRLTRRRRLSTVMSLLQRLWTI